MIELGLEGYGFWWLLLEIIGKEIGAGDKCELSYPLAAWSRKMQCSKRKTSAFFLKFSEISLIFSEYDKESSTGKLKVSIPNLLKYKDEYSKKSGQTSDKLPKVSGAKIEIEIEIEKKQKRVKKVSVLDAEILSFFDQLWEVYPRKIGKPDALKYYLNTVKTENDMDRINRALEEYLFSVKDTEMKYIKHGSAWFNKWTAWEVANAE